MKGKKLLAGILSAAMVLCTMVVPAFAEETAVVSVKNGDKTTGYTKISEAFKAVEDNAVVTYHTEEVSLQYENLPSKQNVTYTSDYGNGNTTGTLMKHGVGNFSTDITKITFDGLRFEKDAIGLYDKAPVSPNLNLTIKNCVFNEAGGNCVYVTKPINSLTVEDCTFNGAESGAEKQYLIWTYNVNSLNISNNEFYGNSATRSAMNIDRNIGNATVSGNTIDGFERGIQVALATGKVDISGNTFTNIKAHVDSQGRTAPVYIHGNTQQDTVEVNIDNNTIKDSSTAVFAENGTDCVNSFSGNTVNSKDAGKLEDNTASYVAEINEVKYVTLSHAVAAVISKNDTVKLLKDTTGDGVQVKYSNVDLTIDFCGHTYTVDNNTVGSPNTQTNAFQLLANSDYTARNITFKNGKITSAVAAMVIQNYSNLTLEDMTLELSTNPRKYSNVPLYTLSNNNGHTTLKGHTNIIATKIGNKNVAFDVCKFDKYPGATVTLDESMTGTIDGKIEMSGTKSAGDTLELIIKNGTVNGPITKYGNTDGDIKIYGGTFSENVSEYCADGYMAEKDENGKYTVKTLAWTVADTDSGYYNGTDSKKLGMMRFMFKVVPTGAVKSTGIKYINANDISKTITATSTDGATAFQGDIVGIPENSNVKCYAKAFIETENGTFWSEQVSCTVDWTRGFANYTTGGNNQ